jgi:poly(A) polymerase
MIDLIKLTKKFNDAGFELFEVGGHVRDSLIGRESHDIDLVTNARPNVTKSLVNTLGSIYDVGEKFGTIGIAIGDEIVEITTYRKEIYINTSRKPQVAFGNSLIDDLARRDFTINAIARNSITGGIIDPFGGIKDIKNKIIRCVGNDNDRFDEDPLRMIRAIRLACQLDFRMEVRFSHPERIKIVSPERVRDEFVKIMLSLKPGFGVRRLCSMGLMDYIIPEFIATKHLVGGKNHIKDVFHHSLMVLDKGARVDHREYNLVFRLACLLHDIAKPDTMIEDDTGVHFYNHHYIGSRKARRILRRLRFDNETIDKVCHLIQFHMTPIMLQKELVAGEIKKRVIMRLIRRIGENNIYLLLDLVKCDIRSSKNSRYKFVTVLNKLVDECMKEQPESLISPLNGDEIMALLNLKPSYAVGKIKTYLTNLVVDGRIDKNDKEGAKEKATEYIKTQLIGEIMNGK